MKVHKKQQGKSGKRETRQNEEENKGVRVVRGRESEREKGEIIIVYRGTAHKQKKERPCAFLTPD